MPNKQKNIEPTTVKPGEGFTGIGLPENDIFYFHPDHLGSTSYITTRNSSISQHVEYIAFGEVLFEEHSSSFSSPYLFNGKELDRETNLSYFGARYYDARMSLWLNVDPLTEKFVGRSPYEYCFNNPVRLIDPTGMGPEDPPSKLYHNTNSGKTILEKGFNAGTNGKFSAYNWFSSQSNAGGTGRTGQGVTIGVEGIDTKGAVEITNRQMKEFYNAAKSELGYTSEQLSGNSKLRAQVDGLKFSKLGEWMNQKGASVYKLGDSYAVTDGVANGATISTLNASKNVLRTLQGIKVAGKVLTFAAIAMDSYEIYASGYNPRVISGVAGGWAGAWAASSATGAALTASGIDFAGPWGWAAHGVITLGAGVGGYFGGKAIAKTTYDYVTTKGVKR